ncbi:protein NEDD1-like [Diorhabda carinulata]|uniref:protein NEDD1-like n=1 Tax=Diorhabda carinulata TaxID=1163345 RepID=UPI0025A28247|nr:protein NEDD1-like [Diorhabda carinulata]
MFASTSNALKLHAISDQYLEPVCTYKPKKAVNTTITNLTWCHDNSYICILQEDSFPQIVSSKDRTNIELIHTVQALKKVTAIKFKQHTKRTMALGNYEGEAVLYDTKNRNILKKVCQLNSPVRFIDFNCNDENLAICTEELVALFSDNEASNNFVKTACFLENASFIKYHPTISNIISIANNNGCLTLKDIDHEKDLFKYKNHNGVITGINFTCNQKVILTTGLDKKICIYDYDNGECVFRININQAITSSDISIDDVCVAVGLEDGSISLYDIRDPLKPLMCSSAHSGPVTRIAFEKAPLFLEAAPPEMSVTNLSTSDVDEQSDLVKVLYEVESDPNEKFMQGIMRIIKSNTDYLEAQLNDHCSKYQNFVMNEFESIQNAMNRWDVFNVGDPTDFGKTLNLSDNKSVKNAFAKYFSAK